MPDQQRQDRQSAPAIQIGDMLLYEELADNSWVSLHAPLR
jgi:hypothetical protein